jgi:hypothetical protein
VVAWREQFAPVSVPDTGSLRGDIDAVIAGLPDLDQAQPGQMAIFAGLATAASRDAELRAEFSNAVLERPRRLVREVLDRAIARGEVSADRDLDLVPDVLIGVNLLHMVLGEAPDRQFTARVLRSVLYPLVTGPAFEPASEPRARRTTRRRT